VDACNFNASLSVQIPTTSEPFMTTTEPQDLSAMIERACLILSSGEQMATCLRQISPMVMERAEWIIIFRFKQFWLRVYFLKVIFIPELPGRVILPRTEAS
jgi:hypothetical protein